MVIFVQNMNYYYMGNGRTWKRTKIEFDIKGMGNKRNLT